MENDIYIPNSMREAGRQIRRALPGQIERLAKTEFTRAWCSVAYLYPGLHPDGFDEPGSGWPPVLKRFAAEAWRRADAGELADDELYPADAQWSGLYDRMLVHMPGETKRRLELAASFGKCPDV
jgi:hypothetical protein